MTPQHLDAIVVGAGQGGGKPLALDLGRSGQKTAIIEQKQAQVDRHVPVEAL